MKIIFLNSWYGKVGKMYFEFIKENKNIVDIFCFTEVDPHLYSKLEEILEDHRGFYAKGVFDNHLEKIYGQGIFFKKGISFKLLRRLKAPDDELDIDKFAFSLIFKIYVEESEFYLVNVHGISRPGSKFDTPGRIKQSENIINFFKTKKTRLPVIVGGDFNLMPDTKSVELFEENGFRNLIKEFSIRETRNKITWEEFKDQKDFVKQHFADFVFVTTDIGVKNFEVPKIDVSDHLPLVLSI